MKVLARRDPSDSFTHQVEIRSHQVTADEPEDEGGQNLGPTPQELLAASLASCMAITMEMYARRKGWDVGPIEVECEYDQAERGSPTTFAVVMRLPDHLNSEQAERLRVIAGRCPVHRTLEGPVTFQDRVELVSR